MSQNWLDRDLAKGLAGTAGRADIPAMPGGTPEPDPFPALKQAADRAYDEVRKPRYADNDQMLREEQIRALFAFKTPNEEQRKRFQALRTSFANLAVTVLQNTRPGQGQDVVIGNLRLCLMMANASVADENI